MPSVYVSGYTDAGGQGIYSYDFDNASGNLTGGRLVAKTQQPSYFVINEATDSLYALLEVTEYNNMSNTGAVQAFHRDPKDGSLTALNTVTTEGGAPCHGISDCEKYIHVANYMGGSVSSFAIEDQGRISPLVSLYKHNDSPSGGVPDRQEAPHAHSIDMIDSHWAISCDLGTDLAVVYKHSNNDNATLERCGEFQFPKGAGPRHVAITKDQQRVYVLTELSVEVYALEFKDGVLSKIDHQSARPEGNTNFATGAEIALTPDNRFLYASLREIDQVAMYKVDSTSGKLTLIGYVSCGGIHPRQFVIDPSGQYLLLGNMNSNTIVVFSIDQTTGHLSALHTIDHPQPTCIQFWK
ncbi:6-phosphogluconolactonase [Lichtheimia corymbifera JMRC:FSU:9682]|uniref:6-phosphogluconolactonase n=1 Tax=Lichtheimia corymbifera JMRC:FSU:9682 TaxID=1263082 RepID=A0A068SFZ8_9FUNG|nr:6-phosphogluconolactonase [Lichtheimia corymbifera JMRC:FSU:9682]